MKKLTSHLLIIVFGLVVGYFIWQSFYGDIKASHSLNWGPAQWITTPTPSPVGLFRKELFISNPVISGWIQVSASDTYDLIINGKSLATNIFYSSNVSGVYDIIKNLHTGKNTISLSVRRLSFPGSSQIVIKGAYTDTSGNEISFSSDSSWKVLDHEDVQGSFSWSSNRFNADAWPEAKAIKRAEPADSYPVDLSPYAITAPLNAFWIRHPSPFPEKANFRKDFKLPVRPKDAWIRIAADTEYALMVNGTKIADCPATMLLNIYDIKPLLRKGENTVEIALKNDLQRTYALYVDGEVRGKDFYFSILTDTTWKAYLPNRNHSFERPFVVGHYSSYNSINKAKVVRELILPFDYKVKRFWKGICVIGLSLLFTYCFIMILSRAMSHLSAWSAFDCFSIASFTLAPSLIILTCLFILQFDIRTDLSKLFNPHVIYVILLSTFFLQTIVAVSLRYYHIKELTTTPSILQYLTKYKRFLIAFSVLCLLMSGAYLRLDGLGSVSLNGDEIATVRYAQSIFDKGYPYITLGDFSKPATTYELLPYPIAASIGLFGVNSTSIRFPSALFGIATIFLIFWVGMRLINLPTGLLAASVYTFMPSTISLAQNARYMVSEQFFTLFCCLFYYKAIEKEEINKRAVYLAAVFFVLDYLTWEGTGYVLPSLLVATLFVKGHDFSWMKNWHLWLASIGASMMVLIQIANRTYWGIPFMFIGSGLSDNTFRLMFLTQYYNPFYYINNFLLTQSNIFHTLLIVAGFPVILWTKSLRYLLIIVFCVLFFFTNTFSLYATRYAAFIQPLLIILSSAVLIKFIEYISSLVKEYRVPILKGLRYSIAGMLPIILLVVNSHYILKLYRLSSNPVPMVNSSTIDVRSIVDERRDIYSVDFMDANLFIKENLREGDIVVTVYSHPTLFFAGKVDYFQETIIDTQILYMDDQDFSRLINKTVDIPTICTLAAFQSILNNHKRVWFADTSTDLFKILNDKEFIKYFMKTMKPVYENYKVSVYLWESGKRI